MLVWTSFSFHKLQWFLIHLITLFTLDIIDFNIIFVIFSLQKIRKWRDFEILFSSFSRHYSVGKNLHWNESKVIPLSIHIFRHNIKIATAQIKEKRKRTNAFFKNIILVIFMIFYIVALISHYFFVDINHPIYLYKNLQILSTESQGLN